MLSRTLVVLGAIIGSSSSAEGHGLLSDPPMRGCNPGSNVLGPERCWKFGNYGPNVVVGRRDGSDSTHTNHAICRNEPAGPVRRTVTAGQTMEVTWSLTAPHPGDCALYVSYDTEKEDKDKMWAKIWEKKECLCLEYPQRWGGNCDYYPAPNRGVCAGGCPQIRKHKVSLPPWLPAGDKVVFHWEWTALHPRESGAVAGYPTVELYTGCFDGQIKASAASVKVGDLTNLVNMENGKHLPKQPTDFRSNMQPNGPTGFPPMASFSVDLCANVNCGANGTCNADTGTCTCETGFTGNVCQTAFTCTADIEVDHSTGPGATHVDGSACCAPSGIINPLPTTQDGCCARCTENPECTGFTFQQDTGLCFLAKDFPSDENVVSQRHVAGRFLTRSTPPATCRDGKKNGSETGIDCGGDCEACATYKWFASDWTTCDANCADNKRTRVVRCEAGDAPGTAVEDSLCEAAHDKPAEEEPCGSQPCPQYEWKPSGWSFCSKPCGSGTQSRTIMCVSSIGEVKVEDALCTGMSTDPTEQSCNTEACPEFYWMTLWSDTCDGTCGSAQTPLKVVCHNAAGTEVEDSNCDADTKPAEEVRGCLNQDCSLASGTWSVCPWGECTAVCGGDGATMAGTQTRDVMCVEAGGNVIDPSLCSGERPSNRITGCNPIPCTAPNWMTSDWGPCKDGKRERTTHCHDATGANAKDEVCDADAKPILSVPCVPNTCNPPVTTPISTAIGAPGGSGSGELSAAVSANGVAPVALAFLAATALAVIV